MCTHMYICMYTYVCMYVCKNSHRNKDPFRFGSIYMSTHMYVYMYLYMYICICVCICIFHLLTIVSEDRLLKTSNKTKIH